MIQTNVSELESARRHGEGRSEGSFDAHFLADVTRVINEPKSVYPMYGTRFCNVPKINMIELIDFNPRLKQSKPPNLNADRDVLVGGRQRRLDRYVEKHKLGALVTKHTGDHEDMVNQIATRIRDFAANPENPEEQALEGIQAIIDEENRRYLQHIDNVDSDDNNEDEDENFAEGEDFEWQSESLDEEADRAENGGEDEDEDDGENEMDVMQEIDMSDVSDEEERNMEHLAPGESIQQGLYESDKIPERQAVVEGSKQSIDVSIPQKLITSSKLLHPMEQKEMRFKLPYRSVLSFTDLGVDSAMIDKECLILEVRMDLVLYI